LEAKDLDINNKDHHVQIADVLDEYTKKSPRVNTPLLFLIKILGSGDLFRTKLIAYMRPMLIKGVVSLINGMKWIYRDTTKSAILTEVLTSMCANMEKEMALFPEDEEEQDPTVQMWLYTFLAQHKLRLAKTEEALAHIEKAIAHTPTVVELYLIKAKILQFGGNKAAAVACTEVARNLDLADKYLNSLSAKYAFKVDDITKANELIAMFAREDDDGKLNCHEMQTMWYEDHQGRAYYRQGNYRLAFKQFKWIKRHIVGAQEDMTDFFQYGFRKGSYSHS
jgi:N-alpha-acetyltransferase 15/16, NatA auxiliary subunit